MLSRALALCFGNAWQGSGKFWKDNQTVDSPREGLFFVGGFEICRSERLRFNLTSEYPTGVETGTAAKCDGRTVLLFSACRLFLFATIPVLVKTRVSGCRGPRGPRVLCLVAS